MTNDAVFETKRQYQCGSDVKCSEGVSVAAGGGEMSNNLLFYFEYTVGACPAF